MPTPTMTGPLSTADYTKIQAGLAKAADALNLADRMESCGIDCAAERQQIDESRTVLENLKREFFPHKA